MGIIFMSCLGTPAMNKVSRMSKPNLDFLAPLIKGTYVPHCTSNCAIGIHPVPPILDLLFANWHWLGFWHITVVFRCKHHLSCPEY